MGDSTDRPADARADATAAGVRGGAGDDRDPVAIAEDHPVLLFDGVCNLCNASIQFVIERDPEARFRFAPLQSDAAQELLAAVGYEDATLDSVVLVEGGEYYAKSDAAIRTARHLGLPYSLACPLGLVPARVRDIFYDFVAEHRYSWFGRREQCMVPTPDIEERFLAGSPGPDG
jgi:predicted DCC family thiol-disulfide oxidoreductase YuxK